MPYLLTRLTQELAEEHMATLIAANVPAKLRYLSNGNRSSDSKYAIFVETEDFKEAQRVLGLDFDAPDDEAFEDPDDADSLYPCPRCGTRKISYPDEPFVWIVLFSLPLLMVPALGWMIWKSARGSKKSCQSCLHTWRSKP